MGLVGRLRGSILGRKHGRAPESNHRGGGERQLRRGTCGGAEREYLREAVALRAARSVQSRFVPQPQPGLFRSRIGV